MNVRSAQCSRASASRSVTSRSVTSHSVMLAVLLAFLLAGCGGESGLPGVLRLGRPATPTPPGFELLCRLASPQELQVLRTGVQRRAPTDEVRSAWAVQAAGHENVSILAALIYGPGMKAGVGPAVWAVSGPPDAPGAVVSLNDTAKQYSDWPEAGLPGDAITLSTGGVAPAIQCAKTNVR